MDFIFTFAVVSLVVLIACIIAYIHNSNRIIRIQEKQLARLQTDNFRLRSELDKKDMTRTIEIHDHRISEDNIPDFEQDW